MSLSKLIEEAEEEIERSVPGCANELMLRRLVAVVKRQREFIREVDLQIETGDYLTHITTDYVHDDCDRIAGGDGDV